MSTVEEQRVIELYKYYVSDHISDEEVVSQPEGTGTPPSKSIDFGAQVFGTGIHETRQTSSPHTTLTALCQLAAIRLGVQRAGISLIARHAQYILAESTRTLNLRDSTKSDETGDSLWMGLTQCNRIGNLCENTVCLPPARDADIPPCFVVPDLRQDPRFCHAPYVAGRPFLKFYCGTPITTASNFNIGSFWVLDDRLLSEFTSDQKRLFGTMSSLVMQQLEMNREVSERKRAMKMGQALSSFVEGKLPVPHLQALKQDSPLDRPPEVAYEPADDSTSRPAITALHDHAYNREPIQNPRLATLKEESSIDSQDTSSSSVHTTYSDESEPEETIDLTFARAAYLIRDALDVQCCVFLDAASSQVTDSAAESNKGFERKDPNSETVHARDGRIGGAPINGAATRSTTSHGISAEVLAFAADSASSLGGDSPASGTDFKPIDAGLLNGLTKRYPNGTMWTFGEAGLITPPENIRPTQLSGKRTSSSNVKAWKRQRESDAASLRPYFPYARQLIFVPLFDAALERLTAGCFAFTNRRSRVMTIESEVVFLKSFVNNVGAELSRMNTIAADRSKSDFIGSISHELRSPLHGLLAAAEFLEETQLDSYQKGLIATQVSCGKTLLEVIEHVLDFSKINSIVEDEPTAGEQDNERRLGTKKQALSVETDIAELFEEVIEGSVAGKAHMAQDTASLNSWPSSMTTLADDLAQKLHHNSFQNPSSKDVYPGVAVLLDFDYQQDWTFTTQPGALRRILMNVLGNALKYTNSGCVKIRLSMAEPGKSEDVDSPSMITLSVADTGKGISKSFLRTRLFRPFNQEDHLSTGCGLGLSIVKSLVASLKGTLQIQSEQGVGTTVSIKLPLIRGKQSPTRHTSIEMPHSDRQFLSPAPIISRTVALLCPIKRSSAPEEHVIGNGLEVRKEIRTSVLKTMLDWLQMRPFDPSEENAHADFVVFLADEISAIDIDQSMRNSKAIALLSHNFARGGIEDSLARNFANFETITAPFGPRKLARTVATCGNKTFSRSKSPKKKLGAFFLDHAESENAETPSAAGQAQKKLFERLPDGHVIMPNSHLIQAARGLAEIKNDARTVEKKVEASDMGMTSGQSSSVTETDGVENLLPPSKHEDIPNHKAVTRKDSARLLLVDDNKINLSLLKTFVKRHKRKPVYDCAENGLSAVNAARHNHLGYDLIFMDVSMPVMDGLEATREIRKLERERVAKLGETAAPPPALIVALTGLADGRNQEDAFASGVDLFMTKPTKFKEIGSLIEEWYSKREQDTGVRPSNPPND